MRPRPPRVLQSERSDRQRSDAAGGLPADEDAMAASYWILNSSIFLPVAISLASQRGVLPRPDHVSDGLFGFRNLASTFGYGRRSGPGGDNSVTLRASWWSCCSSFFFSASILSLRIAPILSCRSQRSSSDRCFSLLSFMSRPSKECESYSVTIPVVCKRKAALRRPFNKKSIAASGQSSRLALPPIGHVADSGKAEDHHEPGRGLGDRCDGFESDVGPVSVFILRISPGEACEGAWNWIVPFTSRPLTTFPATLIALPSPPNGTACRFFLRFLSYLLRRHWLRNGVC
jgi:hypothetical protein